MDVFLSLFTNLLPLYFLIGLGYVAGRWFEVDRTSLANVALYIVMPCVVFGFVMQLDLKPAYIVLPFVSYGILTFVSLLLLRVGRRIYGDGQANLLAMCGSMGNTGYFGLPLVFLLFKPDMVALYILFLLGGVIFEATIGYYIAARGAFDVRTSLKKLARFPSFYAVALAVALNLSGMHMPEIVLTYWGHLKGAYVVLGMMIIGTALSGTDKLVFAPRFVTLSFVSKFALWPLLAAAVIALDKAGPHLYGEDVYRLLIIFALCPPAANIAAFATQMKLEPEKAATTILAGTVFALFYIPAIVMILGY